MCPAGSPNPDANTGRELWSRVSSPDHSSSQLCTAVRAAAEERAPARHARDAFPVRPHDCTHDVCAWGDIFWFGGGRSVHDVGSLPASNPRTSRAAVTRPLFTAQASAQSPPTSLPFL